MTAMLAVALWALHPVQTNVVAYVIQRMASMAGLFCFLSVAFYLRARQSPQEWSWGCGLLSGVCVVLAVASKENGALAIPLIALAEWLLLCRPTRPRVRRALGLSFAAVLALCVAIAVARFPDILRYLEYGYTKRAFTLTERLLTEARLQLRYLMVLVVPDPRLLTLDADVPISQGLLQPASTAAALLCIVGSVSLALLVRRRRPLLAFGVFWFFVAQAMESTIAPLELYYEHRLYLPSVFLFLGISILLVQGARSAFRVRRVAAVTIAVALIAANAAATVSRATTWGDPLRFWADAILKSPDKPRPYVNLAVELIDRGHYDEASTFLRQARSLGEDPALVNFNLAMVSYHRQELEEAARLFREVIDDGRTRWLALRARKYLGDVDRQLGRPEQALKELTALLDRDPGDADAWGLVGTIYLHRGQLRKAKDALREAVARDAAAHSAWNNLGVVAVKEGDESRAVECFQTALWLNPRSAEYSRNLEIARKRKGEEGTGKN